MLEKKQKVLNAIKHLYPRVNANLFSVELYKSQKMHLPLETNRDHNKIINLREKTNLLFLRVV